MMRWARASLSIPVLLLLAAAAGPESLAGVTSLRLDSEPGESIGGGHFYFYGPDAGVLDVRADQPSTPGHIVLLLSAWAPPDPAHYWYLEFAAPQAELLAVGAYENAVSLWAREPGQPGLEVRGDYGCNTHGRFEVKQVAFDAQDALQAFWVTFEQVCTGATLRGEVRFNADVPIVLEAPSRRQAQGGHALTFPVEGHDAQGGPVALSATGMPPGASFTGGGDGTGAFAWTPDVGLAGRHWMALRGQSTGGDVDTVYTRIDSYPDFDDFDHPIPFSTLPYYLTLASPASSVAADDPVCLEPVAGTVWYAFTPVEDGRVQAFLLPVPPGPWPTDATVSFHEGARGALEPLVCGSQFVRPDVVAGRTYHVMVGLPDPTRPFGLRVDALPPPPPNDDFDRATIVTALPFTETIDVGGARAEPGDPGECGYLENHFPNVWYAYTPVEDIRVTVDVPAFTSVFTGPRDDLVALDCHPGHRSFTALAGQTYHVMITGDTFPFSRMLPVSIFGRPPLSLGVSIDPNGSVDPQTGVATVHGTATCSRPAHIRLRGGLVQARGRSEGTRVWGMLDTTIACTGVTHWSADVVPDPVSGHRPRFKNGSASAFLGATGSPDDNPIDRIEVPVGGDGVLLEAHPAR